MPETPTLTSKALGCVEGIEGYVGDVGAPKLGPNSLEDSPWQPSHFLTGSRGCEGTPQSRAEGARAHPDAEKVTLGVMWGKVRSMWGREGRPTSDLLQ